MVTTISNTLNIKLSNLHATNCQKNPLYIYQKNVKIVTQLEN